RPRSARRRSGRPAAGGARRGRAATVGGVETPVEFPSSEPQSQGSDGRRSPAPGNSPAPQGRGSWKALSLPLLTGAVGVGALALLHLRDPHVENSYGICPTWGLFGLYCPGCG